MSKKETNKKTGEKKSNRKRFVIYFDKESKDFITITPKEWSKKYPEHKRNENTTENIGTVLKTKWNFIEFTTDDFVVLCNFNRNVSDKF